MSGSVFRWLLSGSFMPGLPATIGPPRPSPGPSAPWVPPQGPIGPQAEGLHYGLASDTAWEQSGGDALYEGHFALGL